MGHSRTPVRGGRPRSRDWRHTASLTHRCRLGGGCQREGPRAPERPVRHPAAGSSPDRSQRIRSSMNGIRCLRFAFRVGRNAPVATRNPPGIRPDSPEPESTSCLHCLRADEELGSTTTPPEYVLMSTKAPSIPENDPELPGMGGSPGQGPLSPPSFSSGDLAALSNAEPRQYRSTGAVPVEYRWSAGAVLVLCW